MQKVGLLGGTFDPVHVGHLALGKTVLNQLELDHLIYIPAPFPPHKQGVEITPFHHRLAMLDIAIAADENFSVSPIEAEHRGLSYTIDTISTLRQRCEKGTRFFYVIGLDAFAEIRTWKNYLQLLQEVSFVVIERPDLYQKKFEQVIESELERYIQENRKCWKHENGSTIYRLSMKSVPVSSTKIRENLKKGNSVEGMLPAGVLEYIQAKGYNLK